MSADELVRVPDGIDDATAAAIMLKGMTAEYLLHRTCARSSGRYHPGARPRPAASGCCCASGRSTSVPG